MARNIYKIGIILVIATFGSTSDDANKKCDSYQYQNPVDGKPDLVTINLISKSICRISPDTKLAIDMAKNYEGLREAASLPLLDPDNEELPDRGLWYFHGLGYEPRDETVYYSRHRYGVYRFHLNGGQRDRIFQMTNETLQSKGTISDIANDWATGNLYLLFQRELVVLNTRKPSQLKILLTHDDEYYRICVHPNRGYLFLLHHHNSYTGDNVISRAHLDGSGLKVVLNFTEPYSETSPIPHPSIRSLAVDLYEDRLYWTMSLSKRLVRHSKLDGSDLQMLYDKNGVDADAIAVDKNYVYYRYLPEDLNGLIVRYEKAKGEKDKKFLLNELEGITRTMILLDKETQKTREDHPCNFNNNGCKESCFAVPDGEDKLRKVCG